MKTYTRIAIVGGLLALGVSQTNAAAPALTNYDLSVNFKLTSYTPSGTVAIATKDIIANLAGSPVVTSTGTSTLPTFDANAKLVYRQSGTTNPIPNPGFYVLESKTNGAFFLSSLVERITKTTVNITSGNTTKTYTLDGLIVAGKTTYAVEGFSTSTEALSEKNGATVVSSLTLTVGGTANGTNIVFGTVTCNGGKLE